MRTKRRKGRKPHTLATHAGLCPLGVRYGVPDELNSHRISKGCDSYLPCTYLTLVTSYPRDNAALQTADPEFQSYFGGTDGEYSSYTYKSISPHHEYSTR